MSVKNVCLATLVTALLGMGVARGQYTPTTPMAPTTGEGMATGPAGVGSPLGAAPGDQAAPGQPGGGPALPPPPGSIALSKWIIGTEPGCCGPVGANGPIYMETYLQSGLSFPFSDGVFGHTLSEPGWVIQGGGRSLFFNAEQDAAWVIDLSISNIHNPGRNPSYEVPLNHILVPTATTPTPSAANPTPANFAVVNFVPLAQLNRIQRQLGQPVSRRPVQLLAARSGRGQVIAAEGVSIEDLNRTFVNLGGGREWYIWGQAPTYLNCGQRECGQLAWRFGIDGGGRYGSAKLELNQVRHRTDTIAGLYAAMHTDVEYPCGCCTFQAGIRVEYDYTWMDILQQQNDADVQEINLLFTVGARF